MVKTQVTVAVSLVINESQCNQCFVKTFVKIRVFVEIKISVNENMLNNHCEVQNKHSSQLVFIRRSSFYGHMFENDKRWQASWISGRICVSEKVSHEHESGNI